MNSRSRPSNGEANLGFTVLALRKHRPAVHRRHGADDRQAQAVILTTATTRTIHPIEAIEQPRQVLPPDPGSGVLHLDANRTGLLQNEHDDLGTARSVLDGVL